MLNIIFTCFLFISSFQHVKTECYSKWLSGYRLKSSPPHILINSVSLDICKSHCVNTQKCVAFAYGTTPQQNGTCELALSSRLSRNTRSLNSTTLSLQDLDKFDNYDVYIEDRNADCFKERSPLFANNQISGGGFSSSGGGFGSSGGQGQVPIDCFYRLMSGKRLIKSHALKSVSVNSLMECQEACIREISFNCKSVSYRYMPSGYSYSVSNCELSLYYLLGGSEEINSKHDFVEDFDYDYFQREPYCKSTNSLGHSQGGGVYGVCAVIVRRGGRLSNSLIIKSSEDYAITTSSQCEHLCTTSVFRCKAFAFRHTERGKTYDADPFHRGRSSNTQKCQLYETDLSRLPSYNIETDPDFDLFEMGRIMQGECILSGNQKQIYTDKYHPVTSTYAPHPMYGGISGGGSGGGSGGIGSGSGGGGSRERYPVYPPAYPPLTLTQGSNYRPEDRQDYQHHHTHHQDSNVNAMSLNTDKSIVRPPILMNEKHIDKHVMSHDIPYYESSREVCLTSLRPSSSLQPSVSRATFPVKTLEECRIECIRSSQVLRFPCSVMAFRQTSGSGGSCQLSSINARDLLESDFVPASGRYETAVSFAYDDRERACQRPEGISAGTDRNYDRGQYGSQYVQSHDRYGTGQYASGDRYGSEKYGNDRYGSSQLATTDRYNDGNRRYDNGYNHYTDRLPTTTTTNYYGSTNYRPSYQNHQSKGYDRYPSQTNYDRYPSQTQNYDRNYERYPNNYPSSNYPSQLPHQYNPSQISNRYPLQSMGTETTVDGERCLHSCVRNKEAGFYYCQIDQEGAWNFCCRPDEGGQCGFSKGLSFSWCYVGTGPSRNIWRTCNHRSSPALNPHKVSYLHDRQPPTIHTITSVGDIANLTREDALQLFTKQSDSSKEESELVMDFHTTNNDKAEIKVFKPDINNSTNVNSTKIVNKVSKREPRV